MKVTATGTADAYQDKTHDVERTPTTFIKHLEGL